MHQLFPLVFAAVFLQAAAAEPGAELWERVRRGGVILLLRHAQTGPGGRGPLVLEDRATQRLLSPAGERQAERIGEILEAEGVEIDEVRSSRLFRARDTARLAFGDYTLWEVLDALDVPGGPEAAERDAQLRALFAGLHGNRTLVLVTHSPNIQRITGLGLPEGGILVLEADGDGGFRNLGRLDIEGKIRQRE